MYTILQLEYKVGTLKAGLFSAYSHNARQKVESQLISKMLKLKLFEIKLRKKSSVGPTNGI